MNWKSTRILSFMFLMMNCQKANRNIVKSAGNLCSKSVLATGNFTAYRIGRSDDNPPIIIRSNIYGLVRDRAEGGTMTDKDILATIIKELTYSINSGLGCYLTAEETKAVYELLKKEVEG